MDSPPGLLIRLDGQQLADEQTIGGKADKLARLARAGFQVPDGFCTIRLMVKYSVSVIF